MTGETVSLAILTSKPLDSSSTFSTSSTIEDDLYRLNPDNITSPKEIAEALSKLELEEVICIPYR